MELKLINMSGKQTLFLFHFAIIIFVFCLDRSHIRNKKWKSERG